MRTGPQCEGPPRPGWSPAKVRRRVSCEAVVAPARGIRRVCHPDLLWGWILEGILVFSAPLDCDSEQFEEVGADPCEVKAASACHLMRNIIFGWPGQAHTQLSGLTRDGSLLQTRLDLQASMVVGPAWRRAHAEATSTPALGGCEEIPRKATAEGPLSHVTLGCGQNRKSCRWASTRRQKTRVCYILCLQDYGTIVC